MASSPVLPYGPCYAELELCLIMITGPTVLHVSDQNTSACNVLLAALSAVTTTMRSKFGTYVVGMVGVNFNWRSQQIFHRFLEENVDIHVTDFIEKNSLLSSAVYKVIILVLSYLAGLLVPRVRAPPPLAAATTVQHTHQKTVKIPHV